MIEKWENVKGTIKTMGKELSAAFDWAFDRLFSRIELTNEQFVYVLLSVVFIVANAILWVQKVPRFSDHRNRTARGCVQGKNTG